MNKGWATIIVAAGSGQRFGAEIPKQYAPLAGKTVLAHALSCFSGPLAVVVDPAHEIHYAPILKAFPDVLTVKGGATRQDSVKAGLRALKNIKPSHVMIHDAARPLIDSGALARIKNAIESGISSATLSLPVTDTLMRGDDVLDREGVHAIQTPQAFDFNLALEAHEGAQQVYTDDASLVRHVKGVAPRLIEGHADNFKITTQNDLARAEKILFATYADTRTGLGFDIHPFGENAQSVRLFGVDIPCDCKLVGHSDADAGLHAIADAILGTIGAGDIGMLFPPSDSQWKNMDSAIIVKKALDLLAQQNGFLAHIDIMLMAEFPRIGAHREKIIQRLGKILNLSPSNIGLKATTTEKLGSIGRGEGLAVQAIATVRIKR